MQNRFLAALCASVLIAAAPALDLRQGSRFELEFGPSSEQVARIALSRGQSADIVVIQRGVDVVVTLQDPDGRRIDEIDSPNGRNGDEPVRIYARTTGTYRLQIKPIAANEPKGRIEVRVLAVRSEAETAAIRRQQDLIRNAAASWLRRNDVALPPLNDIASARSIGPVDQLAASARLIGLGEATHGSREFGDVRLSLVQRLVTRFGFRVIAIEDNASRWRALEPYVASLSASPATPVEWGWIGRRSRKALLDWVRSWNLAHPHDRVRIVGIDPQDNLFWRDQLPALLVRAYGEPLRAIWAQHVAELAAADEQTQVFGDSSVSQATRDFLQDLLARVVTDGPILTPKLGEADYGRLLDQVQQLAAFADFNSGNGPLAKSRDWYMALATLRAIESGNGKGIYWAHNSHVSTAATSWGPTGALLRAALGCGYRALATTFGEGAFLAQIPNDATDRLQVSRVGAADEDSLEAVLAKVAKGPHVATWQCGTKDDLPAWLREPRSMRWVGGLYAPDSPPAGSYRPYRLTEAFDGVVYFPTVRAEADPGDRPVIPARKR